MTEHNIKSFEDLATAFGTHHDDVKAAFSDLKSKAGEMSARLDEIEQKGVRHGGGDAAPESLGARFIAQDGVKDFAQRNSRNDRFQFETKATLTSATTNAAGSVGAGIAPYRDPTIVPLPRRRPMVRDLLPVIPMSGGSVDVVKILGRTNSAAPVAEAAAKPQSDLQLGLENIPARVIAHWIKASRQVLEDMPQLQGLIDTDLLDGLALVEEDQLLYGDGTGQNLDGLVTHATAYSAPFTPEDDNGMLDAIGLAMLQSALAKHPANGIIMHPADWVRITLMKDGDGNYLFGPPGTAIEQRLWGVPVVATEALTVDKFLVGNFRNAATLYDRWTARVEIGTINDDFTRNLLTVLAEERLALANKDGTAMVYGDFGNIA